MINPVLEKLTLLLIVEPIHQTDIMYCVVTVVYIFAIILQILITHYERADY